MATAAKNDRLNVLVVVDPQVENRGRIFHSTTWQLECCHGTPAQSAMAACRLIGPRRQRAVLLGALFEFLNEPETRDIEQILKDEIEKRRRSNMFKK